MPKDCASFQASFNQIYKPTPPPQKKIKKKKNETAQKEWQNE